MDDLSPLLNPADDGRLRSNNRSRRKVRLDPADQPDIHI